MKKKEEKKIKPNAKVRRMCLKCCKPFASDSKFNRVCDGCKRENDVYSINAEGILDL